MTTTTEPKTKTPTPYAIPSFEGDFQHATDLEQIVYRLVDTKAVGLDWTVDFFWKRKGGQRSGKAIEGKCQKPSGLLKHYSDKDFIIWLAADHCRNAGYDARQIEALLFHELQHIGSDEDEDSGEVTPVLVGHDFEGFLTEVTEYGMWSHDVIAMGHAFQPHLPSLED